MGLRIRGGRRGHLSEKPPFNPHISARGRRVASGSRSRNTTASGSHRAASLSNVFPNANVVQRRKRNEELNQSILKTLDHLMSIADEEKLNRDIQLELEKTVRDFEVTPSKLLLKDKGNVIKSNALTDMEGSASEISINGVLKPVNGSLSKCTEYIEGKSIPFAKAEKHNSGKVSNRKEVIQNTNSDANENADTNKIADSSRINGLHILEPRLFHSKEQQENISVKQLVNRPTNISRTGSDGKEISQGPNQRRVASMGQQKGYKYFNKLSKRNRINYFKKSPDWNPGISRVSKSLGKDVKNNQIRNDDLGRNRRLANERSAKKYLNSRCSASNNEMASCPGTSTGNQVITSGDMTALPMILRNSAMAQNSDSEKDDEEDVADSNVTRSKNGVNEVVDVIDGIEFVTFENEHDMVQFTRLVSDESCKGDASDLGFSSEFPEAIIPKKTKDIKKIKGWQKKKFTVTQNPMLDSSINGSEPPTINDLHPDGIEYEHNYIRRQLEKEEYHTDCEDELPGLSLANLADIQRDSKEEEGNLVDRNVGERMRLWKPSEKSAFVSFSSSNSELFVTSGKDEKTGSNEESIDSFTFEMRDPDKLTMKDHSLQQSQKDHPSLKSMVVLSPTSILMNKVRRARLTTPKAKVMKVSKAVQTDLLFDDADANCRKRNMKGRTLENELRQWSRPFLDMWHVDEERASFAVSAIKPLKYHRKLRANPLQSSGSQGNYKKTRYRRKNLSQAAGSEPTPQRRLLRSSTMAKPPPVRVTRSSINASRMPIDETPAVPSTSKYSSPRKSMSTPSQNEKLDCRVSPSELQHPVVTTSSQSPWQQELESFSLKKPIVSLLPLENSVSKTLQDIMPCSGYSQPLGSQSSNTLDQPTSSGSLKKLDQPTRGRMGSQSLKTLDQPTSSESLKTLGQPTSSESLKTLDQQTSSKSLKTLDQPTSSESLMTFDQLASSKSLKTLDQPTRGRMGSQRLKTLDQPTTCKTLKALDQPTRRRVATQRSKTLDRPTSSGVGSQSSKTPDKPISSELEKSIPPAECESVVSAPSNYPTLLDLDQTAQPIGSFAFRRSRKSRRKLLARKIWMIRRMRKMKEQEIRNRVKENQPQVADLADKESLSFDAPLNIPKKENVSERIIDGKSEDETLGQLKTLQASLGEKLNKSFKGKEFSLELENEELKVFLKPKPRFQVDALSPAKSSQESSMYVTGSTSRSEANHPSELSPPKKTDVEIIKSKSPNSPALARKKLIRELQKLNANFVSVDSEERNNVNDKCSKEFCRLGCVCDSIRTDKRLIEHCGKVECMFVCVCPSTEGASSTAKQLVIGSDTVSRLQEESSRHMARVEKIFHHTVVEAAGELVLPGRQQRERRLPKRFLDESINPDEIFGAKKSKTVDSSGKVGIHQTKKASQSPSTAQYKKCSVSLGQFPNLEASVRCIFHTTRNCPCLSFKAPSGVRRNVAMKSTSKVREKQRVPSGGSAFPLTMQELSILSQNKKNIPLTKTLDSFLESRKKILSSKALPGFRMVEAENKTSERDEVKARNVDGQNMVKKVFKNTFLEKFVKKDDSNEDCYCKDVASDHYCVSNEHLHSVRTSGIDLWACQSSIDKHVCKDIIKEGDLASIMPNLSEDEPPIPLTVHDPDPKSVQSLLDRMPESVPSLGEERETATTELYDRDAEVAVQVEGELPQDSPQILAANTDNETDLSHLVRQDDSMPLFKIVEVKSLPPSSFESELNTPAESEEYPTMDKKSMPVVKIERANTSESKVGMHHVVKQARISRRGRVFTSIESFDVWLKSNRTMCGDLEKMCSKSLKSHPLNTVILMKWAHLSKMVECHSAHLWIRQRLGAGGSAPNSHIFVTQKDRAPDGACVNFLDLEKKVALCAKVAILLRAAKLGDPKAMGCGILVSKGIFWEISGHIKFGKATRKDLQELDPRNEITGRSPSAVKKMLKQEGDVPSDIDGEVSDPSSLNIQESAPDKHHMEEEEVMPPDSSSAVPSSMGVNTSLGNSEGIDERTSDSASEKPDDAKTVVKVELDLETSMLSVLDSESGPSVSVKPKSSLVADTGDFNFGKYSIKGRTNFLTAAQSDLIANKQGSLILARRKSDIAERKDSILLTDSMLNLERVPGTLSNPFMKLKQFGKLGQGLLSPPTSSSSGLAKPVASETIYSTANSFQLGMFSQGLEPPAHILQSEDTESNYLGQQEMQQSSLNSPVKRESIHSKLTSDNKSCASSSSSASLNLRMIPNPTSVKLENNKSLQEAKVFNPSSEKEKMMGSSTSPGRSGNVKPVFIIDLNKMNNNQHVPISKSLAIRVGDLKSLSAGIDTKNKNDGLDKNSPTVGINSASQLKGPMLPANLPSAQKNLGAQEKVLLPKILPKKFSVVSEPVLAARQQMGFSSGVNISSSKAIHVNIIKDMNPAGQIRRKNSSSDPVNPLNVTGREGNISEKLDIQKWLPGKKLALPNTEPRKSAVEQEGNHHEDNHSSSKPNELIAVNGERGHKENKGTTAKKQRLDLASSSLVHVSHSKSWAKEVTVNIEQSKVSLISCNIPEGASETPVSNGESIIVKDLPSSSVETPKEPNVCQNLSRCKEIQISPDLSKNLGSPKSSMLGVSILKEPKKQGNIASQDTLSGFKHSGVKEENTSGKSLSRVETESSASMRKVQRDWLSPSRSGVKEMEGLGEFLGKIQAEKLALASDSGDSFCGIRGSRTTKKESDCGNGSKSASMQNSPARSLKIGSDNESELNERPKKEAILITSRGRFLNASKSSTTINMPVAQDSLDLKGKVVQFRHNSPFSSFDTSRTILQSPKKTSTQTVKDALPSTRRRAIIVSPKKTTSIELGNDRLSSTHQKVMIVSPKKKTSIELGNDGLSSTPGKAVCLSPKKASTHLANDGSPSTSEKAVSLSPMKKPSTHLANDGSPSTPVKAVSLSPMKKPSTHWENDGSPSTPEKVVGSSPKKKPSTHLANDGSPSTPEKVVGSSPKKKPSTHLANDGTPSTPVKADNLSPKKKPSAHLVNDGSPSTPEKSVSLSPDKKTPTHLTNDGLPSTPQKAAILSPKNARTPSPVKALVSSPRKGSSRSPKNASSESALLQNLNVGTPDTTSSPPSTEKTAVCTPLYVAQDALGQNGVSRSSLLSQKKGLCNSPKKASSPEKVSHASSSNEMDEEDYHFHLSPSTSNDPDDSAPPPSPPSSPVKKNVSPECTSAAEEKCFIVPQQQVPLRSISVTAYESQLKTCVSPPTTPAASPVSSGSDQRGDESSVLPSSSSSPVTTDKPQDTVSKIDVVWYRLDLSDEFDKLISDETGFSTSASRLLSAVMIARTSNRTVRLAFDKKKNSEESQEFKKGIYAVPTVCGTYVKIGPYKHNEPTGVRTLKKVGNRQYKVVPNLLKIEEDTQKVDSTLNNDSTQPEKGPGPVERQVNKGETSSLLDDSAGGGNKITSQKPHAKPGPSKSKASEELPTAIEAEKKAEKVSCTALSPEKKHFNMPLKIPVLSIPRLSLDFEKKLHNAADGEKKSISGSPPTKNLSVADSNLDAVVPIEKCDELNGMGSKVCEALNTTQIDDDSPVVHSAKKLCVDKESIASRLIKEGALPVKVDKVLGAKLDFAANDDRKSVVEGKNQEPTMQSQVTGDAGSLNLGSGNQVIKNIEPNEASHEENMLVDAVEESEPLCNMEVSDSDKSAQNEKMKVSSIRVSTAAVSTNTEVGPLKDHVEAKDLESKAAVTPGGKSPENGQAETASSKKDIAIQDDKFENGYLIPNIPKLAPYPVKKLLVPDDSFCYMIEDPSEPGGYAKFEGLQSISVHINEVLHRYVRFFPADMQIEWTYTKDFPSAPGTIDVKSLTKDQFITYKGVFRYSLGTNMSSKLDKLLLQSAEVKPVTNRNTRAREEAKAQLLSLLVPQGDVTPEGIDSDKQVIDKALDEINSLRSRRELLSESSVVVKKKNGELFEKLQGLLKDLGLETFSDFIEKVPPVKTSPKEELNVKSETLKTPEDLGARGRGIKRGRGSGSMKGSHLEKQEETGHAEAELCQRGETKLIDSKEDSMRDVSIVEAPTSKGRVLRSSRTTNTSVVSPEKLSVATNTCVVSPEKLSVATNTCVVSPEKLSVATNTSVVSPGKWSVATSTSVLSPEKSAATKSTVVSSGNSDEPSSEVTLPLNSASSVVGTNPMTESVPEESSASPSSAQKPIPQDVRVNNENKLDGESPQLGDCSERTSSRGEASPEGQAQPKCGEAKRVNASLWKKSFSRVKLDRGALRSRDEDSPSETLTPRRQNSRKLRGSTRCLEASSSASSPGTTGELSKKRKS